MIQVDRDVIVINWSFPLKNSEVFRRVFQKQS